MYLWLLSVSGFKRPAKKIRTFGNKGVLTPKLTWYTDDCESKAILRHLAYMQCKRPAGPVLQKFPHLFSFPIFHRTWYAFKIRSHPKFLPLVLCPILFLIVVPWPCPVSQDVNNITVGVAHAWHTLTCNILFFIRTKIWKLKLGVLEFLAIWASFVLVHVLN